LLMQGRLWRLIILMSKMIWPMISFLVAAGIFFSSSLPGYVSGGASMRLVNLLRFFLPFATDYMIDLLHFLVRKGAHFFVYFVLAFCLVQSLKFYVHRLFSVWFYAWAIASVYGITDEIHQYFVPGRVMAVVDMIINAAGAFAGAAFSIFVIFLVASRRGLRENHCA